MIQFVRGRDIRSGNWRLEAGLAAKENKILLFRPREAFKNRPDLFDKQLEGVKHTLKGPLDLGYFQSGVG